MPLSVATRDLVHKFYQNQEQINGGKLDRYAAVSDAGGLVMGYYDGSTLPLWQWAREYTLADNFFMGAFGGSYLNHFWLICACTPQDRDAPANLRAQIDERGWLKRKADSPASVLNGPPVLLDGDVTPDGWSVNTDATAVSAVACAAGEGRRQRVSRIRPSTRCRRRPRRPIGDTLSAKGISWAWYSGAWYEALKDGAQAPEAKRAIIYNTEKGSPNFVAHHQPFNYFAVSRREARSAMCISRTTPISRSASRKDSCRRSFSTSPRAASTSTRVTPT